MLIIKKRNLLEATENIICHQVNTEGVFGGGLALQIKNKYPDCEKTTQDYIKNNSQGWYGRYELYFPSLEKNFAIANCFTQNKNFETDYKALKICFDLLKMYAKKWELSIAIPYNYGCGIAKGEWQKVEEILIDIFDDYDLTIYKYEVRI